MLTRFAGASIALALLCPAGCVSASQPDRAANEPGATVEEFEQWMTELSNWGRWGQDDQMARPTSSPMGNAARPRRWSRPAKPSRSGTTSLTTSQRSQPAVRAEHDHHVRPRPHPRPARHRLPRRVLHPPGRHLPRHVRRQDIQRPRHAADGHRRRLRASRHHGPQERRRHQGGARGRAAPARRALPGARHSRLPAGHRGMGVADRRDRGIRRCAADPYGALGAAGGGDRRGRQRRHGCVVSAVPGRTRRGAVRQRHGPRAGGAIFPDSTSR